MSDNMIISNDIESEYNTLKFNTSDLGKYNVRVFFYKFDFNFKDFYDPDKDKSFQNVTYRIGLYVDDDFSNLLIKHNIKLYYDTTSISYDNKKIYPQIINIQNNTSDNVAGFQIKKCFEFLYAVTDTKKDKAKLKLIL